VSNSHTTGSVTGVRYVGALVGFNNYGGVDNGYATGSVSGSADVGGLVGGTRGLRGQQLCHGQRARFSEVGGLAGQNNVGALINDHATASVSGSDGVGGLVGLGSGRITTATRPAADGYHLLIGGLAGSNFKGFVSNSYAPAA